MNRPTYTFGKLLDDLSTKKGRYVSYTMYILNLIFIGLYIVGTYNISSESESYLLIIETFLAFLFLFEYISRLDYAEDTWDEVTNLYSVSDILAVLPALLVLFIPILGQISFFRSLQVLRIFRFIRVGLEDDTFFNYKLSGKQVIIAEVITMIILIISIHAGLIFAFENGTNPELSDYGSAFYYSIIALTTTGFGNTVPITTLGKTVTATGLIVAVTVIPWLVIKPRETPDQNGVECDNCLTTGHESDARFCYICGERLPEQDADE